MKRLRTWIAIMTVWLFFFYNIERISEPINVATFVYVFVVVSILLVLLFRPLMRLQSYWMYLLAMPVYLAIKLMLGHRLLGRSLPLTVTEIAAISLSILLAVQIVKQLDEVEDVIYHLTVDADSKQMQPFEVGQSQIYREIRRARKRQIPLSILSVGVSDGSMQMSLSRFLKEFEREVLHRYVNARVGNMLLERLHSTDIITQRNSHFVVLLPETGKNEAQIVINRLQSLANKDLGMGLKIGAATFPEEATTFDQLLESAENQMRQLDVEKAAAPASLPQEEMRASELMNS